MSTDPHKVTASTGLVVAGLYIRGALLRGSVLLRLAGFIASVTDATAQLPFDIAMFFPAGSADEDQACFKWQAFIPEIDLKIDPFSDQVEKHQGIFGVIPEDKSLGPDNVRRYLRHQRF